MQKRPIVAYVRSQLAEYADQSILAFREGLAEAGFVEGHDVVLEDLSLRHDPADLRKLVAELAAQKPAAIVAAAGSRLACCMKTTISDIPVLFKVGVDPARTGLVKNPSRPEGNLTGVNTRLAELCLAELEQIAKWFKAHGETVAIITYPDPAEGLDDVFEEVQAVAEADGWRVMVLGAAAPQDIDFAWLRQQGVQAIVVRSWPLNRLATRDETVECAASWGLAPYYAFRGPLQSYCIDLASADRLLGSYCGRILGGEPVANLPVLQAEKIALPADPRTARQRGLTVAPPLCARANGTIEWA